MQYLFDDNLVVSFREVVEKSLIEFFNEQDLTSFQKMLRNGMNSICATIQKKLLDVLMIILYPMPPIEKIG